MTAAANESKSMYIGFSLSKAYTKRYPTSSHFVTMVQLNYGSIPKCKKETRLRTKSKSEREKDRKSERERAQYRNSTQVQVS